MITGTVTLANTRLSLVDGTAFVDFSAAGTLIPYLGWKLTLTDSAGKKAVGYLKSGGTGETLGDDLVSGWNFTSGWVAGGTSVIDDANTFHSTNFGGPTKMTLFTSGRAYKLVGATSTATMKWINGNAGAHPLIGTGSGTFYFCAGGAMPEALYLQNQGGSISTDISSMTVQQVLTPSSTGATITSTPGGTTYDWESVEAGFNYNDASGYTYTISTPSGGSIYNLTDMIL